MSESTTEFEATTAVGVPIKTFATRALAIRWWENFSEEFPGCRVDEVTTEVRVTRRAVRRPRVEVSA